MSLKMAISRHGLIMWPTRPLSVAGAQGFGPRNDCDFREARPGLTVLFSIHFTGAMNSDEPC